MEKIWIGLGGLCLLYFAGIVLYTGLSSKFPFVWAVVGMGFLAYAGLLHWEIRLPAWVRTGGLGILAAALLLFLAVEGLIIKAMCAEPPKNLDYLLVLGAQVKGNRPSQSLQYRIDEACAYLKENPGTKAVLSGGQGQDEEISEAECMYRALREAGIEETRLLLEDKSTNTNENILFSAALLEKETKNQKGGLKAGIVTNSFHVFRGTAIARKKTDWEIYGISAKSNPFLQVNYLTREFFGVLKDKAAGNL